MLGVTAAIGEFFAALGWSVVRSGATVGLAAMIGTATGVGLIRRRRRTRPERD